MVWPGVPTFSNPASLGLEVFLPRFEPNLACYPEKWFLPGLSAFSAAACKYWQSRANIVCGVLMSRCVHNIYTYVQLCT